VFNNHKQEKHEFIYRFSKLKALALPCAKITRRINKQSIVEICLPNQFSTESVGKIITTSFSFLNLSLQLFFSWVFVFFSLF